MALNGRPSVIRRERRTPAGLRMTGLELLLESEVRHGSIVTSSALLGSLPNPTFSVASPVSSVGIIAEICAFPSALMHDMATLRAARLLAETHRFAASAPAGMPVALSVTRAPAL